LLPLDSSVEGLLTIASVMNDEPILSLTSLATNPKLHEMATLRARSSGSDVILPRHITEAAQALKNPTLTGTLMSPAATLPEHYDSLRAELNKISNIISNDKILSKMPLKVLVIGEVSGVVSSMFRMAGAHVATCDWKPSEIDYVPHFQGDCKYIQDLGWDLVIAHPPCTYLSAVGAKWLAVESDREQTVRSSARLFLSILDSKAPFVVVENPRMHSLAQLLVGGRTPTRIVQPYEHGTGHRKATGLLVGGRTPTRIVQPYEHGTGHRKATGLFLTPNMPPLTPTCLVDDRVSAMADLSRSPNRGSLRSRTYVGIAAAMALQ
jgi:hypothetical protein